MINPNTFESEARTRTPDSEPFGCSHDWRIVALSLRAVSELPPIFRAISYLIFQKHTLAPEALEQLRDFAIKEKADVIGGDFNQAVCPPDRGRPNSTEQTFPDSQLSKPRGEASLWGLGTCVGFFRLRTLSKWCNVPKHGACILNREHLQGFALKDQASSSWPASCWSEHTWRVKTTKRWYDNVATGAKARQCQNEEKKETLRTSQMTWEPCESWTEDLCMCVPFKGKPSGDRLCAHNCSLDWSDVFWRFLQWSSSNASPLSAMGSGALAMTSSLQSLLLCAGTVTMYPQSPSFVLLSHVALQRPATFPLNEAAAPQNHKKSSTAKTCSSNFKKYTIIAPRCQRKCQEHLFSVMRSPPNTEHRSVMRSRDCLQSLHCALASPNHARRTAPKRAMKSTCLVFRPLLRILHDTVTMLPTSTLNTFSQSGWGPKGKSTRRLQIPDQWASARCRENLANRRHVWWRWGFFYSFTPHPSFAFSRPWSCGEGLTQPHSRQKILRPSSFICAVGDTEFRVTLAPDRHLWAKFARVRTEIAHSKKCPRYALPDEMRYFAGEMSLNIARHQHDHCWVASRSQALVEGCTKLVMTRDHDDACVIARTSVLERRRRDNCITRATRDVSQEMMQLDTQKKLASLCPGKKNSRGPWRPDDFVVVLPRSLIASNTLLPKSCAELQLTTEQVAPRNKLGTLPPSVCCAMPCARPHALHNTVETALACLNAPLILRTLLAISPWA